MTSVSKNKMGETVELREAELPIEAVAELPEVSGARCPLREEALEFSS